MKAWTLTWIFKCPGSPFFQCVMNALNSSRSVLRVCGKTIDTGEEGLSSFGKWLNYLGPHFLELKGGRELGLESGSNTVWFINKVLLKQPYPFVYRDQWTVNSKINIWLFTENVYQLLRLRTLVSKLPFPSPLSLPPSLTPSFPFFPPLSLPLFFLLS